MTHNEEKIQAIKMYPEMTVFQSEIDQYIYSQSTFLTKVLKLFNEETIMFSTNGAGIT